MSVSHKNANAFIRKYNKLMSIKGYSGLNIVEKNKLIEKRLKEIKHEDLAQMKSEWESMKGQTSPPPPKNKPKTKKYQKGDDPKFDKELDEMLESPKPKKKSKGKKVDFVKLQEAKPNIPVVAKKITIKKSDIPEGYKPSFKQPLNEWKRSEAWKEGRKIPEGKIRIGGFYGKNNPGKIMTVKEYVDQLPEGYVVTPIELKYLKSFEGGYIGLDSNDAGNNRLKIQPTQEKFRYRDIQRRGENGLPPLPKRSEFILLKKDKKSTGDKSEREELKKWYRSSGVTDIIHNISYNTKSAPDKYTVILTADLRSSKYGTRKDTKQEFIDKLKTLPPNLRDKVMFVQRIIRKDRNTDEIQMSFKNLDKVDPRMYKS